MAVMPFHERMAELQVIQKRRKLTTAEKQELDQCMDLNVKYCWTAAYLENASLLASMTRDVDWQHEICRGIDELEKTPWRKR